MGVFPRMRQVFALLARGIFNFVGLKERHSASIWKKERIKSGQKLYVFGSKEI